MISESIKLAIAPYKAYLIIAAVAGIFAAGGWAGWALKNLACTSAAYMHEAADQVKEAEAARKLAEATQAAIDSERRHAADLARIAEAHEQDKRDAQAAAADVIAGLRAGSIRLRDHWRGCEATSRVSGDAASAALADANARLREKDAGEAIGDAKRADDWIKRLQDALRAGRVD